MSVNTVAPLKGISIDRLEPTSILEQVRIWVENLIEAVGLHGTAVPVLRHILLILAAVLMAWIVDLLCRKVLVPIILRVTDRMMPAHKQVIFDRRLLSIASHIVSAIVIWQLLPMVFYQFPLVREILTRLTAIFIAICSTRLAVDVTDRLRVVYHKPGTSTQQYLQSFCGVLKIIIIFVCVVVVFAILINRSPLTLFAGLGATSAVLMLVFKDTIEGLVAGIRLTSNDMLHIGDWITVPGTPVDGTVTEMTLTTVKVRRFDNTIMTVSPLTLVNGTFQNWKGMLQEAGRRVHRQFFVDFRSLRTVSADGEDGVPTTNVTLFRYAVEDMLRQDEKVNTGMMLMVRQLEVTSTGLPIEVYFFLKQKEWVSYEHGLADIMERVYAMAADFDIKIYQQFPQQ